MASKEAARIIIKIAKITAKKSNKIIKLKIINTCF